jgi:hypothetical protein
MRKGSISVDDGQRIGRLLVGDLVRNVQSHPLFIETRASYLKHGRLRECQCDCGNQVLYSENVLSSGQIKSCGCLKRLKQDAASRKRESVVNKKNFMKILNTKIENFQRRLKFLKTTPVHLRNTQDINLEIQYISTELRKLFGMKGHAIQKSEIDFL